ncbi:hypothetical protein G7Y89_g190 [Cudoniella acicularis]|uniref:Zn(2)-C6 fungal-type domain-containing protein n=1 Tax=Cudoniella acicularis TaxID=354080 RepID=A0A8H4RZB9_9HELO|nr:hypothetical protein G7Y89_g190 [Cudoniella acicularis]
MSSAAEGSEDVTDFLNRIKELGDRRDQEDEERNRKLEEEILQGRKERQARRAERARSISPTKSSPANTPNASRISLAQPPTLSQFHSPTIDPQRGQEPQRDTAIDDAMERLTGSLTPPTKENSSPGTDERVVESEYKRNDPIKASPSSALPSRNSPLSWQRRPNSQASDRPRSRPLSMVATENAARSPRATPTPEPSAALNAEPTLSRDQIAQSLASKDPAWFRQTSDRGLSSPAYRRNQVEDEERSDHGSSSSRVQMPGMSREGYSAEKVSEDTVDRASSPSRGSTTYGSSSRASRRSSPAVAGSIGSPIPLTSAQKLDPPNAESKADSRGLAMSPSQGRISPERLDRPASPTKGMGGFVQSAMMKRSDSVNKRWSVQSPPGLQRGNSVASNRSSHDASSVALGNIITNSSAVSRPSSLSRENSPHSPSRPDSSHSNATVTQERPTTAGSMRSNITTSTSNDTFVKPLIPPSRSQTPHADINKEDEPRMEATPRVDSTPLSSPSKTMDPRRWSPTKSSWLESALNKPESPKPKAAPPPQQPAWMSEINKAKQKASVDLGRSPTAGPKHEVNIGGLMRSPPPGALAKPISIGGLPTAFSTGQLAKPRLGSVSSQDDKDLSKQSESRENPPPTSVKVKPETPPKKDFRSSLKARPVPTDNTGTGEPEFKNVFGQLRRTKTQNYVAPDELKNNITRGKAALNITGGPKKTERKDEFKEAILKKKEDFKKAQIEGKGVKPTSGTNQDASLPEALAKRKAMGRPESATIASGSGKSEIVTHERVERDSTMPNLSKETSAPGRLQGKEALGEKLASRFNPALAGLLARGPPSMASDTSRSSSPASSQRTVSMSTSTTNPEVPDSGPQLTHMTKSRARGPRRKAPSTAPISNNIASEDVTGVGPTAVAIEANSRSPQDMSRTVKSLESSVSTEGPISPTEIKSPVSQPPSPRKLDIKRRSQFLQDAPNTDNKVEPQLDSPKPLSPTKKANLDEIPVNLQPATPVNIESSILTRGKPSTPLKSPSLTTKPIDKSDTTPQPASENLSPKRETPRSKSPFKPTSEDGDNKTTGTQHIQPIAPLWSRATPSSQAPSKEAGTVRPLPKPPTKVERLSYLSIGSGPNSPKSPARSPAKSPAKFERPSTVSSGLEASLVPQASEASQLVGAFFGERKISPPDYHVDAGAILEARPDQGGANIKTLQSNMYQLSVDGKKHLVPSHQERILFEGNMYLCLHSFVNTAGKKLVEVYFWLGDEVPKSVAGEAEIFAQREARSCGGKLITIRQGKEIAEFFQALGGIIIIRRGTSNKYDSLAPHILCGRKQFGQIAFDEVDFSAQSLCSGFPYLISTPSGKSFLWKGKGSGIEELSCARLIGMDFGLTGEIEEIEDGNEPASFLDVFNGATITKSADHWRMKPNYNKYCSRLFCAGAIGKEQILEISPFCQTDLSPCNIYVLDAFFEIYIIVGARAQSQYAAFHNALTFAQEYGIFAASMEDRPFIPVSTVVIEGIPRDLKSVFRKWRDALSPTTTAKPSSDLRRVLPFRKKLRKHRRRLGAQHLVEASLVILGQEWYSSNTIGAFMKFKLHFYNDRSSHPSTHSTQSACAGLGGIRRVKCDEEKPHCRRCTSTGRKCDGYSQDLLALPTEDTSSGILIQRISTHVPGTTEEKRGFSYFTNQTAPELNGFYSSGFWEHLILQASYNEPALRHTVIAIGALHEKFSQKRLGQSPEQESQELEFALNQYTKAIGHLRRALACGKQTPLTCLLACILFVCFESLRGYYASAIVHLQSGLKILRDLRRQAHNDLVENTITPLFLRLSMQSILYIDTREQEDRKAFAKELTHVVSKLKPIPNSFETLEEARTSLNETTDSLFRMFYMCDGNVPMASQPANTYGIYQKYDKRLVEWNTSFEKFMAAKSASFTSKQIRGAALLKIHETTARIMGKATPSPQDPRAFAEAVNCPKKFEGYKAEFQTIINLSKSLIAATDQDGKSGKTPLTFSTDLGLVAPLYYTAVKSASKPQRLEALELLRCCPRREGMWDSVAASNLITEFWEIEAMHKSLQKGAADELNLEIPMHEVIDLVFQDGGHWKWIWKDSRSVSPVSSVGRMSSSDDMSIFSDIDLGSAFDSEEFERGSYT